MATKGGTRGGVVLVCLCMIASAAFMGGNTVAGDDETWQDVLTTSGENVVFGASNTYTIWAQDIGIGYVFRFFFGLGFGGDAVRTDTTVTLGANGDSTKIYACTDGKLELVAVNSSGTPENAIIRVRYNTTDSSYRLQITENSPAVFVQFTWLSLGGLLCTSGVAGTPIRFASSSSGVVGTPIRFSSSSSTIALRQVVET